jgi:hypothetical protein
VCLWRGRSGKKGGARKACGNGGSALLMGHGREVAEEGLGGEGATRCREDMGPGPDRGPVAVSVGGAAWPEQGRRQCL